MKHNFYISRLAKINELKASVEREFFQMPINILSSFSNSICQFYQQSLENNGQQFGHFLVCLLQPLGRSGLVVRCRPRSRKVTARNPIPLEIRRVLGLLRAKLYAGMVRKLGEGVLAQALSSSSERGSKLRGPSHNTPRVASKRDVTITKLQPLRLFPKSNF
ncbi:hypothetical protein AVEN_136968-1 [Araneus ventricosus]|uniref:Uncharacterized protein n=1 Tax=Araneus ventricosus TaxID=182803 RepID=A0A4Y2BIU0_ARAVE|nr:hypothetical protein AVEN_136968-1 [Araneus ventricosus]